MIFRFPYKNLITQENDLLPMTREVVSKHRIYKKQKVRDRVTQLLLLTTNIVNTRNSKDDLVHLGDTVTYNSPYSLFYILPNLRKKVNQKMYSFKT